MAWPVRINGHVYTEDMFFGWGYQTALPSMINDVAVVAQGVQDTADNVALIANTVSQDADSVRVALQEATQLIDTVVNNPNTLATTSTPITISSGIKTFTIQPGKSYVDGMIVLISSTDNPEYYLSGTVTAYNPTTGEMSVNAENIFGSGTYSSWNVTVTGVPGLDGSISELVGTSTTSLTVAIGSKTLNVGTGKSYSQGMSILVAVANNNQVYMYGLVDSYNQSNGTLVFTCEQVRGSGTYANWNISISGVPGPDPTSVDIYGQSEYITLTTASRNITTDNKRVISVSANDWNYSLNLPNPSADLQGVRWTITNEGIYPVFIKNGSKWLGKLYPKTSVIVSVKVVSGTYKYTLAYSDGIKRSIMVEDVKTQKYVSATINILGVNNIIDTARIEPPLPWAAGSSNSSTLPAVSNARISTTRTTAPGLFAITTSDYVVAGTIANNDNITFGAPFSTNTGRGRVSTSAKLNDAVGIIAATYTSDALSKFIINQSNLSISSRSDINLTATSTRISTKLVENDTAIYYLGVGPISSSNTNARWEDIAVTTAEVRTIAYATNNCLSATFCPITKATSGFLSTLKVKPIVDANGVVSANTLGIGVDSAMSYSIRDTTYSAKPSTQVASLYVNKNSYNGSFYTEAHLLTYPYSLIPGDTTNTLYKTKITIASTTSISAIGPTTAIIGPDNWQKYLFLLNEDSITYNGKMLLMNDSYSKVCLIDAYSDKQQSNMPWDYLPPTFQQSVILFVDDTRFIVFYTEVLSGQTSGKVCYALGHINPDD